MGAIKTLKEVEGALPKKNEVNYVRGLDSQGNPILISIEDLAKVQGELIGTPKGGYMRSLFESAGARFNDDSGFYELNGLTDITEEQMIDIYVATASYHYTQNADLSMYFKANKKIRTNLLINPAGYFTRPGTGAVNMTTMCEACENLEVVILCKVSGQGGGLCASGLVNAFQGCYNLKRILGNIGVGGIKYFEGAFYSCLKLEEVRLEFLEADISFKDSPNLSKQSILYLIQYSSAKSPITITLHQTAYDMAMGDEDIQAALSEKTMVSLAK